jgi:hypothetical protein
VTPTLAFILIAGLFAQTPPAGSKASDGADARLAYMKKSVKVYGVRPLEGPKAYTLRSEPVMRFVNTVGSSRDGAIFLWDDDNGRPGAAMQIMVLRGGTWAHEWTSLTTGSLVARSANALDWNPSEPGVEFKPIPGAPKPAGNPEQRLVQMRGLTREFTIEDKFRDDSWQRLRPLTKPFARYGKAGSDVADGALFAYVLTTDPEAFLLIEARAGSNGAEWQYALAPMTVYALRATLQGKTVWEVGYRWGNPPSATFHNRELPLDADAPREPDAQP